MAILNLKESQLHARESDALQVAMQQEIAMSRSTLDAQHEDITRLIGEKTLLTEEVTVLTDAKEEETRAHADVQAELLVAQKKVASLLKKLSASQKGESHSEIKNPA